MSKLGKIFGAMLLLLSLWGLLEVPGAGFHGAWPASPLLILAMMVALVLGVLLALTPALARGRERLRAILLTSPDIVFYTGLFLAATLGYAVLTWRVFDGVPVLDDDVSSLMQARILATGHIRLPLPPHPEFFWIHCWLGVNQGLSHMCSMYPPGHPLVLLPGVLAGVPWLVTPLFGGALAVVTARAGQQLFNRATGRLAGILSLGSPFVAELAITHLSHVPTAFFVMLALLQVHRLLDRDGGWRAAFWAGLGLGMAFLCRPMTAMICGVLLGGAVLWRPRRVRELWAPLSLTVLLVLLAVLVYLFYTEAITTDWRLAGHKLGLGRRGKYGFGEIDWARTHTVRIGWRYTLSRLGAINIKLLGWPVPAFLAILAPWFTGRPGGREFLLLSFSLALLAVYMPFWYYESAFPARYIFSGLPMLLLLAAHGLRLWAQRLRVPTHVLLMPLLLCGSGVALPWHLASFPASHWDVESLLPKVVRKAKIANAVIFMDAQGHLPDRDDPINDYYATGFMRNNLSFDGEVIYARNLRERNDRLARQFPERDYYLYRYQRHLHDALLYRLSFDGKRQILEPVDWRASNVADDRPLKTE